jgi:hypothetical protein
MGLFKRSSKMQPKSGKTGAMVHLGDFSQGVGAVEPYGTDDSTYVHVFAAFFDKHLANLKNDRNAAHLILELARPEWEAIVEGVAPNLGTRVGPEMAFPPLMATPGVNVIRLVESVATPQASIDVQVVLNWNPSPGKGRLGASTRFHPLSQAPMIAHFGLEVVWAWTKATYPSELQALALNLLYQCEYYESEGLPGMTSIGKAPHYGAMCGNRDRLIAEIAAFAGITVDKFESLSPDAQDRLIAQHSEAGVSRLLDD